MTDKCICEDYELRGLTLELWAADGGISWWFWFSAPID
jgi:hypothetical protein